MCKWEGGRWKGEDERSGGSESGRVQIAGVNHPEQWTKEEKERVLQGGVGGDECQG